MGHLNFFSELKRRNVYKVAVAYAIVGWLLVQVATQVFPFLEIPNWIVRLVIALVAIGFPIALIIAWAFELTPKGLKRTEEVESSDLGAEQLLATQARQPEKRAWIFVAVIAGAMSLGLFFLGRYTAANTGKISASELAAKADPGPNVIQSIAVLPLDNYSADPQQEYFVEGMTDELITDLAIISQLRVVSRSSTTQFKGPQRPATPEIARLLKVDAVVEGSVQRDGDKVRINAQLIDARADRHIWAKSFERNSRDVLALQNELA